ncbi:ecto-NOX disulfide-thiol exchanger 2-like isoform X2 [Pararge aegeria]|nr:ecto-NOX disulfide-thiol exchanger 2-like isoform X2 [Pararge aegeria]
MRMNRRDKIMEHHKNDTLPNSVMNPMMMQNMMMPQGNMMMPAGMFNMMMPNAMMSNSMLQTTGMEMPALQPQIDMSAMGSSQPMQPPGQPMDMGLMRGVMMDPLMGMFPNVTGEGHKEIILKHCKLMPPTDDSPHPPRRARPPGCRTIFVGGLPELIRESTVREIFERYGRIHILRLSKKNFCHIRFDRESCVDVAMTISGYRIKLLTKDRDDKDDDDDDDDVVNDDDDDDDSQATNGWLHVDYALSRDDQNEYERRQRQAFRVQQQQMQQLTAQQEAIACQSMNFCRSPSPLRIQLFSNAAMVQLAEKIKSEEHFANTLPTLISWLERGECSKKTSNQFYSMIQATNSHIRRLFGEKMQAEEELQECKERVKTHIQNVIDQLEQVAKVFHAATHQRVWDHFTKPQRKNIETWQKMTQEFNTVKEEFREKFFSDESDFNGYNKANSFDFIDEAQQLKKENESLRFQLEAYKNEVEVIKADAQKEIEKFKAQYIARQALQDSLENKPPLPSPVMKPPPPPPPPLPDDLNKSNVSLKDEVDAKSGEAKLIGVMSAFLQVHPQGASLDYVVSYVRALFPSVSQATIHRVLQKHSGVFQRTTSGVGANIENRWTFVAFKSKG